MRVLYSFFALLVLVVPASGSLAATTSFKGPKPVIFIPWGSGPGQAGKLERDQGESAGPASFALSATGEFYLLDQVNARILKFSPAGSLIASIPTPVAKSECGEGATFDDIAIAPNGYLLLLDTLVLQSLIILEPTGKEVSRYPFSQLGISTRKGAQAIGKTMLLLADGLYLEHLVGNYWFRPLDQSLGLVKYNRYPGLPFKSGQELLTLQSRYDPKQNTSVIALGCEKKDRKTKKKIISVNNAYLSIPLFTFDMQNNIYLVFRSFYQNTKKTIDHGFTGITFDENLKELSRFKYKPPSELEHLECPNSWKVAPEGKVYHMSFTPEGVRVLCWE